MQLALTQAKLYIQVHLNTLMSWKSSFISVIQLKL